MATNSNLLRLTKGIYWEYRGLVIDQNEEPLDLTDYMARMKVRSSIDSDTVLAELTTENGRIVLSVTETGRFTLNMPSSITKDLPLGSLVFDILMIPPSGKEFLIAEGARIKVVNYASR